MTEAPVKKNFVNLLVPELLPVKQRLTLARLLAATGGLAVLLAAAFAVLSEQLDQSRLQLAEAKQQSQQTQTQLTRLMTEQAKREKTDRLDQALAQTREQIRIQQRLMRELAGREQLKNEGFSNLLTQLASHHERQVWLTRIRVKQGDIELYGNSLDSAAVPRWVQGLKGATALSGRQFASLEMGRDRQGALTFSLLSQLPSNAALAEPPLFQPRVVESEENSEFGALGSTGAFEPQIETMSGPQSLLPQDAEAVQ